MENLYRTLGILYGDQDDIKKAYRRKVKQHHPDVGGDGELIKEINAAYEVLGNEQKRQEFHDFIFAECDPEVKRLLEGLLTKPSFSVAKMKSHFDPDYDYLHDEDEYR